MIYFHITYSICYNKKCSFAQTSGSCGENATWTFDTQTKTLTISGTGKMADYDDLIQIVPWDNRDNISENIKTIVITQGITSFGENVFGGCTSLTSVTISNSVTEIGLSG